MISKYPLKKYSNIKGELRIKTASDIAIRDGLAAAKEYCIKAYKISEATWDKRYKPRIMQNLKDHSPASHYPQFNRASELKR